MSRELYRVPLDFDWPIGVRWKGYVNPYYRKCPSPDCQNGLTLARARLEDLVRLFACSADDAARGQCHPYFFADGFYNTHGRPPSKDFLELTHGIEEVGKKIDTCTFEWAMNKSLMLMAGLDPDTWGLCPVCKGEAIDPAVQEKYDAWQREDPPKGEGWQMWETTSEGSPISPVFKTPEELARWLANTGASTFGRMTATYEAWLKMIRGPGWAPSAVGIPGVGLVSGVEAVTITNKDKPAEAP